MRHLEIHILQSVPVSCLNRDDLNSPKSAFFGGVKRARVSSQCWKRAIREYAKEIAPELFKGERTKLLVDQLTASLTELGIADAGSVAKELAAKLITIEAGKKSETIKTSTLFFTSPAECRWLAEQYAEQKNIDKTIKAIKANKKNIHCSDAADISLFGRMVASTRELTLEGAAMFGHAISTHKADAELDYFTALDDLRPEEQPGADMLGDLEFQSATYYRFAAVNLDMLADSKHLGELDIEQRKQIMRAFVEAVIKAMPAARKNSMNGFTLPGLVLAIVREKGHPVQLVNAFETPVRSGGQGYLPESIEAMRRELENLENRWGLVSDAKYELGADSPLTFDAFMDGVIGHVR